MFVQIIQGKVADPDATRATMDEWLGLHPPAGWLGATYGITDDGVLVACLRFEDATAAQAYALHPRQGGWWREMERQFSGPVTFHHCRDVRTLLGGDSDDATFVQVVQGRVTDRDRFLQLVDSTGDLIAQHRPDLLGMTIAIDDDDVVTETATFTNEQDARRAERKQLPAELREVIEEEMTLLREVEYLDLHAPWFATARR